jgi:hypothetical protein
MGGGGQEEWSWGGGRFTGEEWQEGEKKRKKEGSANVGKAGKSREEKERVRKEIEGGGRGH